MRYLLNFLAFMGVALVWMYVGQYVLKLEEFSWIMLWGYWGFILAGNIADWVNPVMMKKKPK